MVILNLTPKIDALTRAAAKSPPPPPNSQSNGRWSQDGPYIKGALVFLQFLPWFLLSFLCSCVLVSVFLFGFLAVLKTQKSTGKPGDRTQDKTFANLREN